MTSDRSSAVAVWDMARLARSRDIVRVKDRLCQNETVFLHPMGVDKQCDEARRSLEGGPNVA